MKKYTRILSILTLVLLTIVMPATAQSDDNKNKAIVETTDGTQQLNTDEISIIRFEGDKVTFVQPWGESVFDRTLRSLTFLRPLPGTLRLTVQAGINENKSNRAQAIDAGKLKSTWESGDVVYVYADASSTASIGTLTPASEDYGKSSATLQGNITGTGLGDGSTTLYFSTQPRATYSLTTQDGTVENLFYCTASASATITGGNATISGNLSFSRPFAVVKFSLKDKGNGDAAISATSLTVNDGTGTYVVTPASATDVIYVGIPAISSKTITLNTTDGSKYYYYQKTSVTFAESKYYAINVKMKESELARPLTFEAEAGVFTVTLTSDLDPLPSLEYSIDGGAWTTYICNAATPEGHTISFRGNNSGFFYYDGMNPPQTSTFSCSADCYLYGNMMSLLSESSYATITSVGESAFCRLFYGNTNIYSHDTKQLLLPATTLARSCYESLFNGCTHLTTAPNLPAKTLAEYCYLSMFNGCTGLVNAPVISAETLAANCCIFMFSECTSLTTGPTLSATTLVDYCYQYMFQNCSSLNSVTCLATDISASGCTFNWLDGVAATGTFAKALSMTSWTTGSSGIPSGWATKNVVNLASLTGDYEAQNNVVLTGTLAGNYKITIADGATVTLDNATINGTDDSNYWWSGLNCLGDATIILADGSENTVKGFDKHKAGIYFPENKTLTIQGSTGRLNVSSNGWAAGIGGSYGYDCGNIRIEGGIITATGCYQCPGIGASSGCGTITITGGTITSTGGEEAPGIGARNCGKITITGGTVTATGGQYGAGIGCKKDGITGGIEIGGTANVTAAGGEKAAGVGSGYCVSRNGTCGNISIGGTATVTATGGSKAAGIGSGYGFDSSSKSQCGTITIASTVTSITATKGADATNSIGKGEGSNSTCGTVTIGGTEGAITESPYTYAPAPVGAIDSKFTINASGDQVYFSQGNLQATTTDGWVTWTFSFMEHQYSTVETASQNVGSYYESQNTVSLFGWGTSGISDYTPIAGQYWPSTTGNSNDGYYAYGDETKNLYDENGKADWGYNAISNGGNTVNCGWRTLTTEEWQYLFENHSYGAHTVYGKNGIIILPDGVSSTTGFVSGLDNWTVVTNENWDAMEAAGAVFLPAAGYRSMSYVYEFGNNLYYWSSTHRDNDTAYCILFDKGYPYFSSNCPNVRCCGSSVRLVKDAN